MYVRTWLGIGQTLFGAGLGLFRPVHVDVGGQFGGFRQNGHLVVGDLGESSGYEDPFRRAALTIVQVADLQRGKHGRLGRQEA